MFPDTYAWLYSPMVLYEISDFRCPCLASVRQRWLYPVAACQAMRPLLRIWQYGDRDRSSNALKWGIHLTQVATRCCGRAKASTKKRIPRLLLWRGVGLRSASDSRSCRPKAATAMNSRVGRLGGHSHDARNLTFLFRSREATTHRVYLNEVDTPLARFWALP